jgi:hypothetical protein
MGAVLLIILLVFTLPLWYPFVAMAFVMLASFFMVFLTFYLAFWFITIPLTILLFML